MMRGNHDSKYGILNTTGRSGQVFALVIALLAWGLAPTGLMGHKEVEGLALPVNGTIEVDGNLEEWEDVKAVDSNGQLRMQWDKTHLYLAFRIADEELLESVSVHEIYRGDSVEIGLDIGNDGRFDYGEGDYQFAFSVPDKDGLVQVALYRRGNKTVEVGDCLFAAGKRRVDGYDLEIRLAWEPLEGFVPLAGESIGFEFVVTNYRTGQPVERYSWSGGSYSMREPIRWGDLIFCKKVPLDRERILTWLRPHRDEAKRVFHEKYADPVPGWPLSEEAQHSLLLMRERLTEQLNKELPEEKIRTYLETIQEDGSWPNLDSSYKDGYAAIEIYRHLFWVFDLAVAWHFEDKWGHGDPEVLAALNQSLNFWLENDFQFSNWWNNEIGVPLYLARIGLLMGEELSPDLLTRMLPILKRAYNTMTGQNLLWINQIVMIRGVLEENPALVQRTINAIASEIVITTEEGIQPDYSFHQHGSQLYSHGYGAGFLLDSLSILSCTAGTVFELPEAKREIIEHYLLDGSRWMARGTFGDYSAHGRGITRRNASATYLAEGAEYLLEFPTGRAEELKKLAASASGNGPDDLEGNRHFYRSDFMVHRRKAFYASVKMYSARTIGTESMNGEGLKSYYLPDGCLFLVQRGDEYEEIQPLWDWRKIPGVTCPQSDDPIPSINHREAKTTGNTSFVGGVSDGWYGCAAYDYERDGVTLKKGYFGFDWGMVCLGADLQSVREEPIATTVNQCWLRSAVLYGNSESDAHLSKEPGAALNEKLYWVYHDGVLYQIVDSDDILLESGERTGSWYDINRGDSKDSVRGDVFTLSIQHGVKPKDGSYAYAVYPGVEEFDIGNRLDAAPYMILANRGDLQAVADPTVGITQCIFYKAGSVELPSGAVLSVDKPCAVLLNQQDSDVRITVANPMSEALDVIVSIREPGAAEPVKYPFSLPGGDSQGGSSVTK